MKTFLKILVFVLLIALYSLLAAKVVINWGIRDTAQDLVVEKQLGQGGVVTVAYLNPELTDEIEFKAESDNVFAFSYDGVFYDSDPSESGDGYEKTFLVTPGKDIVLTSNHDVTVTVTAERPMEVTVIRKFSDANGSAGIMLYLSIMLGIVISLLYWMLVESYL